MNDSLVVLGTIWYVSIRDEDDLDAALEATKTYIGVIPGCAPSDVTAPETFQEAGYTTTDAVDVLSTIVDLIRDPVKHGATEIGLSTQDHEGRSTTMFIVPESAVPVFGCVEEMHAVWPGVFDALGADLSSVRLLDDGSTTTFRSRSTKVPKALRLKSGWDYDGAGNQIWLSFDEAYRRFVQHVGHKHSKRDMKRMRGHMVEAYADREKAR